MIINAVIIIIIIISNSVQVLTKNLKKIQN